MHGQIRKKRMLSDYADPNWDDYFTMTPKIEKF